MAISLIYGLVDLLNRLPYKDVVYDTLSPSTIVEVIPKMEMGQKKIAFFKYEMVHIGTINTMRIRCVPVIELKASTDSGGYSFMILFTEKNEYLQLERIYDNRISNRTS